MRSILEELWYGNVGPNTGCREATAEEKQLMGYITKHHEDLEATLHYMDRVKQVQFIIITFFQQFIKDIMNC